MTAADAVLIPLQCEYYALEGLTQLLATIDLVRDHLNPRLAIDGVVLTMSDGRTNLSAEVDAEARRHLGETVYDDVYPAQRPPVRGAEPRLPIARYRPTREGAGLRRARRGVPDAAAGTRRRRPPPFAPADTQTVIVVTVRPERAHGLGRGLAALIPQRDGRQRARSRSRSPSIRPNPNQPRAVRRGRAGDAHREHPRARRPPADPRHGDARRLSARRRRAPPAGARLAGLERIPAIVRHLDDRDRLELALVENLQREDLDPIEAAHGFRRLIDEFGLTHEDIADAGRQGPVDRWRTRCACWTSRRSSRRHRRSAHQRRPRPGLGGLSVEHQEHVLGTVIDQDLSVRQTEELVRRLREPKAGARIAEPASADRDPDLERVEEDLRRASGTKVSLARSRRGGRIVIEYYSDEELGRLYERLTGGTA